MTIRSTPRTNIANTTLILSPILCFVAGVAFNHWSSWQSESEATSMLQTVLDSAREEEIALRNEIESLKSKARLDAEYIEMLEELDASKHPGQRWEKGIGFLPYGV